jgi:hypothetical protein
VFCTFCQTHKITHGKWRFIEGEFDKGFYQWQTPAQIPMDHNSSSLIMPRLGSTESIPSLVMWCKAGFASLDV